MIDVLVMLFTKDPNLVCELLILILMNLFSHVPADSVLTIWTGGFCCPDEKVSLLACVVKGGYHSVSQYQWYQDEISLSDEHYPIMYASQCGVYRCDVRVQNTDMKPFTFTVQGAVVVTCILC